MRKETGDERYQCRSDAERASLAVLLKVSLTRPLCMSVPLLLLRDFADESQSTDLLGTESIVFFFSVCFLRSL